MEIRMEAGPLADPVSMSPGGVGGSLLTLRLTSSHEEPIEE